MATSMLMIRAALSLLVLWRFVAASSLSSSSEAKQTTSTTFLSASNPLLRHLQASNKNSSRGNENSNKTAVKSKNHTKGEGNGNGGVKNDYASDDDLKGDRVLIHMFDVLLSPNTVTFQTIDLVALHALLQQVIGEYISAQLTEDMGVVVDYVLLGTIQQADEAIATTRLMLGKGVVNFNYTHDDTTTTTTTTPSRWQVNTWVLEAVNDGALVAALKNTTSYSYISNARYVQLVDFEADPGDVYLSDDPNGDPSLGGLANDQINAHPQTDPISTASGLNPLIISVCVLGAAVLVALVVLGVVVRKRRRNIKNDGAPPYVEQHNPAYSVKEMMEDKDFHDNFDSDNDENPSDKIKGNSTNELNTTKDTITLSSAASTPNASRNNRSILQLRDNQTMDGKSLAGESESEFTVNTEAGDSMALQSLSSPNTNRRGFNNGQYEAQNVNDNASTVTAESFERERPVSLQKDMLTSSWAGHVLLRGQEQAMLRGVGGNTGGQQNESVLQPSHFTASEEIQQRYNSNSTTSRQQQQFKRPPQPQSEGDEVDEQSSETNTEEEDDDDEEEGPKPASTQDLLVEQFELDGSVSLVNPDSPAPQTPPPSQTSTRRQHYRAILNGQPHPYHQPSPGDVV